MKWIAPKVNDTIKDSSTPVSGKAIMALKNNAYPIVVNKTLTSTETTYTTYNSRKFSDYDVLIIEIGVSSSIRNSCTIPSNYTQEVSLNTIHGSITQTVTDYKISGMTFKIVSDTTFNSAVNGSGSINILNVYGVKLDK